MKNESSMLRKLVCLIPLILLMSCATAEETANDNDIDPDELTAEEFLVDEELFPDWYKIDTLGEASDGVLTGYAKSLGSDVEWAYNNALRQAGTNLRIWVDDQLEEARTEVADAHDEASDREFILQLRNAVTSLDFPDVTVQTDDFENGNGSLYVVVKVETSSTDVLDELGEKLSGYSDIWNQMLQTDAIRNW
jgi:hypothetical protein